MLSLLHSRGSRSSSSIRSRNHSTSPEEDSSSNMSNETKSTTSNTGGRRYVHGDAAEVAATAAPDSVSLNKLKKRRKRKKAKSLSTMSCEGYNIEQRNFNTFECTDDISDLLKFYKKFLPLEELPTTLVPQQQSESTMLVQQKQMPTVSDLAFGGNGASGIGVGATSSFLTTSFSSSSSSSSIFGSSVPAAPAVPSPPSTASTTLLPNTGYGYIRSWKNSLNFTLMITLRLKNDTKSLWTVFSIRNTTHNLYVETSANGLRLLRERDNATDILLVKFQLYDNRWHQVSIRVNSNKFSFCPITKNDINVQMYELQSTKSNVT